MPLFSQPIPPSPQCSQLPSCLTTIRTRIQFSKIPNTIDSRVFIDMLNMSDLGVFDVQDLYNVIERKLPQLGLPAGRAYTAFHRDTSGDRVVVDDQYFHILMEEISGDIRRNLLSGTPPTLSVEVEISSSGDVCTPPELRAAALAANNATEQSFTIQSLREKVPSTPSYFIRGVILSRRIKGQTLIELEICDVAAVSERITLLSFDAKAIDELSRLRANGTEVVEIRGCTLAFKSQKDKQYETNNHPCFLRFSASSSRLTIQNILPERVVDEGKSLVTFVAKPMIASIGSAAPTTGDGMNHVFSPLTTSSSAVSFKSIPATSTTTNGVVKTFFRIPSVPGTPSVASTSSASVSSSGVAILPYHEPGLRNVSAADIQRRDVELQRSELKIEAQVTKIKSKGKVSTKCLLCDFDAENREPSMQAVRSCLSRSFASKNEPAPTYDRIIEALEDRRKLYVKRDEPVNQSSVTRRFYCLSRFFDLVTKSQHLVHPRCAHICEDYQKFRSTIEDIALHKASHVCYLCKGEGAVVKCYHPECNEEYHVLCAIFSKGYVNFGNDDPLRPWPACPKHTLVSLPGSGKQVKKAPGDRILFDSGVVEEDDLRDPDGIGVA